MSDPEKKCIYCQTTHWPKTAEHVLNKAFGANLTLTDEVCDVCNGHFSPFDKDLLTYIKTVDDLRNHPAVNSSDLMFFHGRISLSFDDGDRYWFAIRHSTRNQEWIRVPLQQVIIFSSARVGYVDGEAKDDLQMDARRATVVSELSRPERLKFTCPDWQTGEGRPSNPILARSAPNLYAVVAESELRVQEVIYQIRSGLIGSLLGALNRPAKRRQIVDENVSLRIQLRDLTIPLAKIAFNFACKILGYDNIQRPEFDWIRRAVRYNEAPSIEFVTLFFGDARRERMRDNPVVRSLCAFPGHKMILFARPGEPLHVNIVLFEELLANIELLRAPETTWMEKTVALGVFNYTEKTSEVLTMPDDDERLAAIFGIKYD